MYFHLTDKYNALLDVEFVARDSWSPPPVHGWEGMDLFTSRVQHIQNPQAFSSFFSVALVPSFHIIGSRHPWIFHPIRELCTSNRIDECVQRSMDGDYPRVACNNSMSSRWAWPIDSMGRLSKRFGKCIVAFFIFFQWVLILRAVRILGSLIIEYRCFYMVKSSFPKFKV